MSFGFATYEANGTESFTSIDSTWTVLYAALAPAYQNITFSNVPIMPTRIVTRQMLNQIGGDDEAYVHNYVLSGGTLTCTCPNASETVATYFVVYGK